MGQAGYLFLLLVVAMAKYEAITAAAVVAGEDASPSFLNPCKQVGGCGPRGSTAGRLEEANPYQRGCSALTRCRRDIPQPVKTKGLVVNSKEFVPFSLPEHRLGTVNHLFPPRRTARLRRNPLQSRNQAPPPMSLTLRRPLTYALKNSRLSHRFLSSAVTNHQNPNPPPPPPQNTSPRTRTRTPLEKQFETWLERLKPGFTSSDVDEALRSQSDPDLALDIFRWTAQQRGYKHDHVTYLTAIQIAVSGKRFGHAETLIEEVIAGACPPSVPLYNSMIRFCCGRKLLFNRAFDIYKKMLKSDDTKPSLETYTLLLNALLRRFNKLNVCYVYLHAVRSLTKQMKASGVIPDTFVLNMIVRAYSKCLEVDEAVRVFREMGLYGCEPNAYTYSYIVRGLCEKGRVNQGLGFYKEMKGKDLVPKGSAYMILICSLAMEQRFEDATGIVFDMLGNHMAPDLLTYKTLLEELCREGRGNDALELLEELKKKDTMMNERTYKMLLNGLHSLNQE
ncbi:pentatricopeptide repeat-containing protein At3g25210, mitochondrial [Diospyros lotus]|uniref:pentatricopeptide repeat-containing protein At3g25210, mitochondrial n=1 Tax=Diospyros lotus TaxID=55363 RepID=UPI00224EEF63|nr:pentatricopeptide repeat-containing protein At3g25210, mitochondrial [Diospyros lotus]